MKTRNEVLGLVLAAAVGFTATPVLAQRGPGPRAPGGPRIGQSVEIVLQHQEEIGLSSDQVAQLQELEATIQRDVAPLAEEMQTLRDQIREGAIDPEEGFRQMEALRGELITAGAPLRGRVQEILTVEQHQRLQALVRQGRPGIGRRSAIMRGRGQRAGGGRAFGPALRGQGPAGPLYGPAGQGRVHRRGWIGWSPDTALDVPGLPPEVF